MGRQGPGARDRTGKRHGRRADVRLDEPRGAAKDRRAGPRGLLQPLPQQALVQGRGIRPCADRARHPARLRQRRGAAESHAAGP